MSLTISFDKSAPSSIEKKINFKKTHKDTLSLNTEVLLISETLKKLGYFTNTYQKTKSSNKNYTILFTLNKKIDKAIVKIDTLLRPYIFSKNNLLETPIEKLESLLLETTHKLEKDGKSFSKIHLKNIYIDKNLLFADLVVNSSIKRKIDSVIVKGYNNFPTSYLHNYFNLKKDKTFNKERLNTISNASKNLKFIKEIKKPEVLFTKDSTLLYLYLKKQQNNSFDGIVNFTSKDNGDLLFNGNINLKLNNILNKGEKFELFWNSIADESQEFRLSTDIAYIFNSKISPQLAFSIYKQDSTFLNTNFDAKLFYNINNKTKIALTYASESSENLKEEITNNITTFSNFFLGVQLHYSIPNNDFFFNDKFMLALNPSFGKRKTEDNNLTQFKIKTSVSYLLNISNKSSVFIKNTLGILNSDSFIDNELFRIGGANSLRGFNEQSIFTNNFTYFNIEYRLLASKKSYLYTITDIARVATSLKNDTLLGLGFGYKFRSKNSDINIGLVGGTNGDTSFSSKNTKLILNWVNYF